MWTLSYYNEGWKVTDGTGERLLLGENDENLGKVLDIIDGKRGNIVKVRTINMLRYFRKKELSS